MDAIDAKSCCQPVKVRLTGEVAGIAACELVTDRAEIVLGSRLDCDLCLNDPLVQPRACIIRRRPVPPGQQTPRCAPAWIIEALPSARIFVNGTLTQTDTLAFGDTIRAGCHTLIFSAAGDRPRNFKSITAIADVCNRLLSVIVPPPGYLQGTPDWQARNRRRTAGRLAAAAALAVTMLFLFTPRRKVFEQVQPPLEIVMLAEQSATPPPQAVRALKDVQRRIVEQAAEPQPSRELAPAAPEIPQAAAPELAPLRELTAGQPAAAPPPAPALTAPELPPLAVSTPAGSPLAVPMPARRLQAAAPARRLSVKEAADLLKTAASPLTYEQSGSHRMPVARLPGKLAQLEVPGADAAFALDGTVSEAEIAMSWKSGRFRNHGPGQPPEAEPPTYCYVARTRQNNRECLYISFTCIDPDIGGLKTAYSGSGTTRDTQIINDDSVEIFLDTNFDRTDFHHLIVNARGAYWSAYYSAPTPRPGGGFKPGVPQNWDPRPQLKTVVNRDGKQWNCEILIPFDQLGGAPKPGSRWAVNFCRNYRGQGTDQQLSTWFLVYDVKRSFHNPQLFGIFQW